jgi:hypothetical protein
MELSPLDYQGEVRAGVETERLSDPHPEFVVGVDPP